MTVVTVNNWSIDTKKISTYQLIFLLTETNHLDVNLHGLF